MTELQKLAENVELAKRAFDLAQRTLEKLEKDRQEAQTLVNETARMLGDAKYALWQAAEAGVL